MRNIKLFKLKPMSGDNYYPLSIDINLYCKKTIDHFPKITPAKHQRGFKLYT